MQMEAAVPVGSGVCVVFCIEQCSMPNGQCLNKYFFYLLRTAVCSILIFIQVVLVLLRKHTKQFFSVTSELCLVPPF